MVYDYSIQNDTLNGVAGIKSLELTISISTITIACKSITTGGDNLHIEFKAAISANEKTTLDNIVSTHDGVEIVELEQIEMKPLLAEGGKRKTDRGLNFIALAGVTTSADYDITEDLQIKGGILVCDNNEVLDTIGMVIVDKTYMWAGEWYPSEPYLAGISVPEGTPWSAVAPNGVDLHSYIKDFPVSKSGETNINNEAITTTPLNGLTIRISYTSTGATDVKCNVGILAYS